MNGEIKKLSKKVCNQISAGEVIERPASAVKELVENSVDAGAENIEIELKAGGRDLIRVKDDGRGFPSSQIEKAFHRYTTSKIESVEDIYSVTTLGFRGEALASIAAVSKLTVKSRHKDENKGSVLRIEGGDIMEKKTAGLPPGAEITVEEIFFNTPARYKHMKKASTEAAMVSKLVTSAALARPRISFSLLHNDNQSLNTPGNGSLKSTIYSLYGEKIHDNLLPIDTSREYLRLKGFIGSPLISRSSRQHEFFFVNQRPVKNQHLHRGVEKSYSKFLPDSRYPLIFLSLEINPIMVDVNVHPSKKRIKFSRGQEIEKFLAEEIGEVLKDADSSQRLEKTSSAGGKACKESESASSSSSYSRQSFAFNGEVSENIGKQRELVPERAERSQSDRSREAEEKEAETETEASESPTSFQPGVIGQLHNLFILYQGEDRLYIIDQHNAHERVIYDKLKEKLKDDEVESSMLLTPINLELPPRERELLNDIRDDLRSQGFIIEEFGPSSYALTAVPSFLAGDDTEAAEDLIYQIMDDYKSPEAEELQEEMLKNVSCQKAVTEGEHLEFEEMKSICEKLFQTSNPYHCPHKRPIVISLGLEELKKRVER